MDIAELSGDGECMNVRMEGRTDGHLADGVKQRLLDWLEVDSVEKKFNRFLVLTVDGQMHSTATHVIHAAQRAALWRTVRMRVWEEPKPNASISRCVWLLGLQYDLWLG